MRWTLLWVFLIAVVLVPFFLLEDRFNEIAATVAQGGTSSWVAAGAISALLALDVFLPVPSSLVSTAAGVLLGVWNGAAVVWTGMTAGCLVGYVLGGRASGAAEKLVGAEGLDRAARLANRYGDWAIVLCRPVPVLAEATVLFAGLVRAPFGRFLRLTAYANLGIALGYSAFGAFSMRLDSFVVAFVGALLIPAILMAASKWFFGRT